MYACSCSKVQPDTANLSLKLFHTMDLGHEVNGRLTTLLWKVEKLLENQERVLKNQDKLLKLMENQQGMSPARSSVSVDQSLINGVRAVNPDHSGPDKHSRHTGEATCSISASLLEAVAHVKSKSLQGDTSYIPVPFPSTLDGKVFKAASRILAGSSTTSMGTNGFQHNPSVRESTDESVAHQNAEIVRPVSRALNVACVNCDSSSSNKGDQQEQSSDSEEVKELLSWAERIQKTSCSVGNFSVNLVKVLFTKDEMLNRNCSGTRGKVALDSGKLDLIKFCAFKLYSVPPAEQDIVWKHKCVVSIDEFLRRGNRARVQNRSKDATLDLSVTDCVSEDVKVNTNNVDETCNK